MSFQELFMQSKGQPIIFNGKELKMVDRINLASNEDAVKITFLRKDSEWRQGIVLQTKGKFLVNNQKLPNRIVLWEDTATNIVDIFINSKDKILIVYNVWDTGDGTMHYWYNGGAMYVKEDRNSKTYYCNDGWPDDDLDDLIFKIEFLNTK